MPFEMKLPTKRICVVLGICVACTVAALLLENSQFSQFAEAENYTQDLRTRLGRKTPVDPRLVLIGIDRPLYEASDFGEEVLQSTPILRELQKSFPWRRAAWAGWIEKLAPAGPKVIAFDL